MLNIYDVERARRTILRREPPERQNLPPALLEGVERIFGQGVVPSEAVARILASVREEGDQAVRRWSQLLDEVQVEELRIPNSDLVEASQDLPAALSEAQRTAADRIRGFHERQPLQSWTTEALGGKLGQRLTPIRRVGIYVPGGSAPLPSSLLMSVIPAQVAGVEEIVVCTPPRPHATILAAAHLCGLETVYQIGGAQAIAAMAYGTESVPKVCKIFGPGNTWVTCAKNIVSSDPAGAAIDMPAGPSELLVIADRDASADFVAADLLSQAEHGVDSQVMLLTTDADFARQVQAAIDTQIKRLSRAEFVLKSLANSQAIIVQDIAMAVAISNRYAPEHLILQVTDPRDALSGIRNAGSVFIGPWTPESVGDYCSGTNHVLPTNGFARSHSGLGVEQFQRTMTVQELTSEGLAGIAATVMELARLEGLDAHAAAVRCRLDANT